MTRSEPSRLLLGIDLGGTKTSVCVGTAEGRILGSHRVPTRPEEGPSAALRRTLEAVARVMDELGVAAGDLGAVGVAAPGPLSASRGVLLAPPNMTGWINVPWVQMLEEGLKVPVFMNNDANACALAEWTFGEFKGVEPLVYLTMSTGLGAGIIANGGVLQGANDLAGEAGYHVLDVAGPPSPCGHRGSFEAFCGGKNVADRLRERIVREQIPTRILDLADGRPEQIDFRVFFEAAREGDDFARTEWNAYVERLAQGIGNLIMILNPKVIVLGTIALHAGSFLLDPLRTRLQGYVFPPALEMCTICTSKLGTKVGDLGALAVAMSALPG